MIFYRMECILMKKQKAARTKIYNFWVKKEIVGEKATIFCDEK